MRRQEIVRVIDLVAVIKVDDAPHAVFIAIGVGDHGMRREYETG